MLIRKRTIAMLSVLTSIAIIVTIYSACAFSVATAVHEYNGILVWPTPGYTFLPWPIKPTGVMIAVITPLNQADIQYYRYIVQSGVLVVLTLLSWLAVFVMVLKIRKHAV
jgi:hypothetical protein